MAHKQALLTVMHETRAELEAAVAAHRGRLDAALGDDWTVRDAIAHVAIWERIATRRLTGAPLPIGEEEAARVPWDLDVFNNALRDLGRTWIGDQILAEFADAHQALLAIVESALDEDCAPTRKVWQVVDQDSAGHYYVHFPVRDAMAERWPQETGKR